MVCRTGEGASPGTEDLPEGCQSTMGASCSCCTWEDGEPVQEEICFAEGELQKQEEHGLVSSRSGLLLVSPISIMIVSYGH
ncbi:hypothetical protein LINPERPRIM_LOCUS39241 [Linum perenne]